MREVVKVTTALDYAREVLGRLPSQGIRFDIAVKAGGSVSDLAALLRQRAVIPAVIPAETEPASPPLVEGEFEWL